MRTVDLHISKEPNDESHIPPERIGTTETESPFPPDELLIITESNCIPSVSSKTVIIGRGRRSAVAVYRVLVDGTTHLRTDVCAIIGSWSVRLPAGRPTG